MTSKVHVSPSTTLGRAFWAHVIIGIVLSLNACSCSEPYPDDPDASM